MRSTAEQDRTTDVDVEPEKRRGRRNKNGIGADAILEATKLLLRSPSADPLTQSLIAKAAGVDDKMVRYHFKDLDTLLDRLTEGMVAEFSARMGQASRAGLTAQERIRARIGVQIDYLVENPRFFWLIFERLYRRDDEGARSGRADFNRASYQRLEDVVRLGRREGALRKNFDARMLYLAIIGMTTMIGQARPIAEVLFDGEDLVNFPQNYSDFVFELVLSGVTASFAKASTPDTVSAQASQLRNLLEENGRLRDLLADASLELQALRSASTKPAVS